MSEIADNYQWKFEKGNPLTVKMNMGAIAAVDTFVPVGLTSNLIENADVGGSVWGVVVNQAGASVLATDPNDPPVVLVSEDAIYEVRCTGDLELGDQVQVLDDNAVTTYVSANLACGTVVDYDPASSAAYNATDKGYSICHIKPHFVSNWPTGYLNES